MARVARGIAIPLCGTGPIEPLRWFEPSHRERSPLSDVIGRSERLSLGENGRDDWIRTSDLLVPNQAHYQAVLHPANCGEIPRSIPAFQAGSFTYLPHRERFW